MNDTKMIKCENIHKSYGTLEVLRGGDRCNNRS